jgi:hypothetical protein
VLIPCQTYQGTLYVGCWHAQIRFEEDRSVVRLMMELTARGILVILSLGWVNRWEIQSLERYVNNELLQDWLRATSWGELVHSDSTSTSSDATSVKSDVISE